ncbi:MAG TPA: endonuclease VII domain-containing protein, partial [Acidimicrobiia bacterium]|nr:endonuclease VII domain-containing protein [Acidimicrobiia bacterium]
QTKPFTDFYANRLGRDGYRPECKACNLAARKAKYAENPAPYIARVKKWQQENADRLNAYRREYRQRPERKRADRDAHLRRKYGIGIDEFEALLAAQGGGCAICGAPPPEHGSLHVDHDHATGAVRGLLCVSCNNALGAFRESHDVLRAAADYLDRDDELAALACSRAQALTV